jgi:hypothetical protein
MKISVPELLLGKDVEGGICGLFLSAIPNSSEETHETGKKHVKITDRNLNRHLLNRNLES